MGDINVHNATGTKPGSWGGTANDTTSTLVRVGEKTLAQLAERLGVSMDDLRRANPQLAGMNQLPAGMKVRLPVVPGAPTKTGQPEGAPMPDAPPLASGSWGDARLDSTLLRAKLGSPDRRQPGGFDAGTMGGPVAYAAPANAPAPNATQGQADPRFAAVTQALNGGRGAEAMTAARQLIASLQADRPPQIGLLNHAHMALAAASLMNKDLDSASAALRTIDPRKLGADDKQRYGELRDLVKDARREAFSSAFEADTKAGGDPKGKGAGAADQAAKLAEFLQATEPGNQAEIAETRLKQANALLLGGRYREAEKALQGVDEKNLDPDQKVHLKAVQDELHAQQIDALAGGYDYDMKHKRYKEAVSNSTAMVNNIAKYFPDRKEHLAAARLQQSTAQIMNGDMDAARQTLGRISGDDLKRLPEGAQKHYRNLTAAVREHAENTKKLDALKADQTAIQNRLKTIDSLTTSGDKTSAQKAVPLAEQLVADIRQKYPENESAIGGARLSLANARMAAGDLAGAKAEVTAIAGSTKDPVIRDQAQFLQARIALREGQTGKGVEILQSLSEKSTVPELRKGAKEVIISIEADHLAVVDQKAMLEAGNLVKLDNEKRSGNVVGQFFKMPSKPLTAMENYQRDYNILTNTATGASMAASVMKNDGLTLAELKKMSHADLVKRVGPQTAQQIMTALGNPDVNLIAKHDFGGHFSWENNRLYVDPSYFDSSLEKMGKWVGDKVRGARAYDEELKKSDSVAKRMIGYGSAFILDRVSDANGFIKDKIKTASDFYNDPVRKDTWYAKLGRAGTFGGDMLTSVFTMPATIVDYKANDKERAGAILGTLVMAATVGAIKSGGPAWKTLGEGASKVGSRIARTDVAQWIGKSEFGQWAGRTAGKVGDAAVKLERRFEQTGFAQRMDKVKDGLGKLNPTIGGGKPVTAPPTTPTQAPVKSVDDVVDDVMKGRTPGELRNSVTADEMTTMRAQFEKEYRSYWEARGVKDVPPADLSDKEIRRMVLGDKIYFENYNPAGVPKKATISQAEYETRFHKYDGPTKNNDNWHVRSNKPAQGKELNQDWLDGDVRRFYFNVKPDKATQLADYLAEHLNRQGIQFNFKIPRNLENFKRADAGVLYVEPGNYQAVKNLVLDYAKKHPEAFEAGSPAFTKPLAPGISSAHEPVQSGLPARIGKVSHGESRSDIVAEAILDAPANATKEQVRQLVRERLQKYGFDPDRPWLKQKAIRDDL